MAIGPPPVSAESPRARLPPMRQQREADERREAARLAAAAERWRAAGFAILCVTAVFWMAITVVRVVSAVRLARETRHWHTRHDWERVTLEAMSGSSTVGLLVAISVCVAACRRRLPQMVYLYVACAAIVAGCYGSFVRKAECESRAPDGCTAVCPGGRMLLFCVPLGAALSAVFFITFEYRPNLAAFFAGLAAWVCWTFGIFLPYAIAGSTETQCLAPAQWNDGHFAEWEDLPAVMELATLGSFGVAAGTAVLTVLNFCQPVLGSLPGIGTRPTAAFSVACGASLLGCIVFVCARAAAVAIAARHFPPPGVKVHALMTLEVPHFVLRFVDTAILSVLLVLASIANAAAAVHAPPPADLCAALCQELKGVLPASWTSYYSTVGNEEGQGSGGGQRVASASPPPDDIEMVVVAP
eukprot:TRINITY_DN15767_c0_g1_i1.p1 TRINITY_DN15767_c0_g1~~TRINITY_DN15767_c0_g1_i1.p1  ORF type:complete len:442 (+),score=155.76 TRINITY_DN15767_c0_g1_i1:90-1328(+)